MIVVSSAASTAKRPSSARTYYGISYQYVLRVSVWETSQSASVVRVMYCRYIDMFVLQMILSEESRCPGWGTLRGGAGRRLGRAQLCCTLQGRGTQSPGYRDLLRILQLLQLLAPTLVTLSPLSSVLPLARAGWWVVAVWWWCVGGSAGAGAGGDMRRAGSSSVQCSE